MLRRGAAWLALPNAANRYPEIVVVGGLGFEPRLPESESGVLPLNYPPILGFRAVRPGAISLPEIGASAAPVNTVRPPSHPWKGPGPGSGLAFYHGRPRLGRAAVL